MEKVEPDSQSPPEYRCPECGRDATARRSRASRWTDRSVLIPWTIWLLIVFGVIAWVSPWGQSRLGNFTAIYGSQSTGQSTSVIILSPPVSVSMLRDEPKLAKQRIDEAFDTLGNDYGSWWKDASIHVVFVSPEGTARDSQSRGVGGTWISTYSRTELEDMSAPRSGDGPWDYPEDLVGELGMGLNESSLFVKRKNRLNGAQYFVRKIDVFQLVAVAVSVVALVLLCLHVLTRVGVPSPRGAWTRAATCLLAVTLVFTFGWLHEVETHTHSTKAKVGSGDCVEGSVVGGDTFEEFLFEADRARFMELLLSSSSDANPADIFGYCVTRPFGVDYVSHAASMAPGGGNELLVFHRISYTTNDESGTIIPAPRPASAPSGVTLNSDLNYSSFSISFGLPMQTLSVSIYWVRLIFLASILYVIARFFRRLGSYCAYRTQRRRYAANQCIFCAYPVPDDALAARSAPAPS